MDYEKAYKEALERAKKRFDANPTDGYVGYSNEILKEIFPELEESNDEKIRKSIIKLIQLGGYMSPADKTEAIAYLERQKYEYEVFEPIESTLEYKAGFRAGIESERKKEQQPAEWGEEDDAAHTRILGAVAKAFMGVLPTKPSEEDVHWLKSLPERFNLQPKQEWSKEDEKIRKTLLDYYKDGLVDYTHVEWLNGITYGELRNFLKSLRPSWKPSEEQMGSLNYAYCELFKRGDVKHNILGSLQNLIDTLRKL